MKKKLEIFSYFDVPGTVRSITPHGNGHINNTFLIETVNLCGKDARYILQAVNKNVFTDAVGLMNNIQKVTEFLKKISDDTDPRGIMRLVPAKNGLYYHIDEEDTCWRVYDFIENAVSIELPETLDEFYECGYAFGNFQKLLNDFPVEELSETIVNFHNTPWRYENFKKAVEEDVCGRAASVKAEIDFVNSEKDFYSVLFDNQKEGKLPFRVTHNDTKPNNVMLDASTKKALCVIDLDTIMPGFSVNDFGDAIRFGANTAAEDEKDLSKVSLSLELFEAYAKGFLEGTGGLLSADEVMLMPEGAKMMTIECGMRFLTDYLQGDTYFKTHYEGHNLDRCRTQFELVRDMNRKWDQMKEIVGRYAK